MILFLLGVIQHAEKHETILLTIFPLLNAEAFLSSFNEVKACESIFEKTGKMGGKPGK